MSSVMRILMVVAILAQAIAFRTHFRAQMRTATGMSRSALMCAEEGSPEVEVTPETPAMAIKSNEEGAEGDDAAETVSEEPVAEEPLTGFAAFGVGQNFEGKVVNAKQFGVFVDIGKGQNALIPRSTMTRGSYEKLKGLVKTESKVAVELIGVNAENQTISAKYIPANFHERADISTLEGQDLSAKFYEAVVVSTHDFGVFVELEQFGVEGLCPASKLPTPLPKGTIQDSYQPGATVTVKIEQLAIADKKLVLSMDCDPNEKNPMSHMPHTKWFQGIVQSVASFGLFVRPAGFDTVGLVHHSRVPRGLTNILKKSQPIDSTKNQTDCEQLFQAGDVVRCRVHSAQDASRKIELSMLPYRANEEEDDDYVVEGRDPEGFEDRRGGGNRRRNTDDGQHNFDPEDTLLWWKGAPYIRVGSSSGSVVDEEVAVINESSDIVEGTWRRLFEVDMREDAADFTSKVADIELKELEEEIGELSGLDEDLVDTMGFGEPFNTMRLGSFVPAASLPAEWRDEMEFFGELETSESTRMGGLKAGKASEQAEFEALLKEVEAELAKGASKPKKKKEEEALVVTESEDTDAVVEAGPVHVE